MVCLFCSLCNHPHYIRLSWADEKEENDVYGWYEETGMLEGQKRKCTVLLVRELSAILLGAWLMTRFSSGVVFVSISAFAVHKVNAILACRREAETVSVSIADPQNKMRIKGEEWCGKHKSFGICKRCLLYHIHGALTSCIYEPCNFLPFLVLQAFFLVQNRNHWSWSLVVRKNFCEKSIVVQPPLSIFKCLTIFFNCWQKSAIWHHHCEINGKCIFVFKCNRCANLCIYCMYISLCLSVAHACKIDGEYTIYSRRAYL